MDQGTQKTILIIEDEASQRKALAYKFTEEGFRVVVAKDGKEGFRIALQELPDLIILDLILPKMDGVAMMKKLRAENAWGAEIPVVILTNATPDNEQTMKAAIETEPAHYLVKTNWKIQDVVEKVRERLAMVEG